MAMGLWGGEEQVEPKAAGQRWKGPEQREDGTKSHRERNQKREKPNRKTRHVQERKERGTNQGKPLTGREKDQREGWTTRDRWKAREKTHLLKTEQSRPPHQVPQDPGTSKGCSLHDAQGIQGLLGNTSTLPSTYHGVLHLRDPCSKGQNERKADKSPHGLGRK
ncbi:hypothetical protein CapIbe_023370 [Capra ibex]